MPPAKQEALLAKAHDLARSATRLAGLPVAGELRGLLRGMNSYYTNRIEGQHTRPLEIEQALARNFCANKELAARQRLAVAHIDAEAALQRRVRRAATLRCGSGAGHSPGTVFPPAAGRSADYPFIDGNGRVMRLHTHAVLAALGYTNGLWSPLRGFARSVEQYYARLADADSPRRGDLDGRGNLSEQGLVAWIDYVLDVCLDQVKFMDGLLDISAMERRIAACLTFEEQSQRSGVRREALRPLHYLFVTGGELERGEFKTMTGLGERTAVSALSALIRRGLLKSDTPQGKVRFALPLHALRFYFPSLWPEAEADAAA